MKTFTTMTAIDRKLLTEINQELKKLKAEPVKLETIPTHFRFKDSKEADYWGCTVKEWVPISEIKTNNDNYFFISSLTFAWVSYDATIKNLEFKNDKFTKKDLKSLL